MEIEDFPCCCTAKVLKNFGETHVTEGQFVKEEEKALEERIVKYTNRYSSLAVLTTITNSEQKTANKVLKKLGFKSTKWLKKVQHKETKINIRSKLV